MARGDDFAAPVPPDNPPRSAGRRPPAEPASTDASRPASPRDRGSASKEATHVASMQAPPQAPRPPEPAGPQLTVSRRLTSADLMHGPVDPEADLAQSGIRFPRYLIDAMRATVATSRGRWDMQKLAREAVKGFLPPDVVAEAWQQHGGPPPPPPE